MPRPKTTVSPSDELKELVQESYEGLNPEQVMGKCLRIIAIRDSVKAKLDSMLTEAKAVQNAVKEADAKIQKHVTFK